MTRYPFGTTATSLRGSTRARGQTMVEFALALPVFLLLVFGVIEFGRLLMTYSAVFSAAREAARYGAAVGTTGTTVYDHDCAGMKAAAVRVGGLGGVQESQVTIRLLDSSRNVKYADWCAQLTSAPSTATVLGDIIDVHVNTLFWPILPLVNLPSVPVSTSSARTIIKEVAEEGVVIPTATIPIYTLTILIDPPGAGTVTTSPTGTSFQAYTVVTLTPHPNPCYVFTGWTGSLSGSNNPDNLTMNGDMTVTANFVFQSYTLGLTAGAGGSVSGGGTYACNTSVNAVASPLPSWGLLNWTDDNNGGAIVGYSTTLPVTLTSNKNYTAHFVTPAPFSLTININPSGAGTATGAGNYVGGTTATLLATPNSGYVFKNWTWGASTSTNNPTGIVMVADTTVTANFVLGYTLTVNIVGSGTVTKSPDLPGYASGTVVGLAAAPALGWQFSGWTGGINSTKNPESITMNNNKTVTATFVRKEFSLTVTKSPTAGGTVTINPNQATYYMGDSVQLTALASPGYQFVDWGTPQNGTLTVSGNQATFTFDGNGNGAIQANFVATCAPANLVVPAPNTDTATSTGGAKAILNWTVTNNSAVTITLQSLTATWKPKNSTAYLNKVSFGGASVWAGTQLGSPASPPLTGALTIAPGTSKVLTLDFTDDVDNNPVATVRLVYSGICTTP